MSLAVVLAAGCVAGGNPVAAPGAVQPAAPDARAATAPACLGAAARDPEQPCRNPRLRLKVRPTPDRALITPNLACRRAGIDETVNGCVFGTPATEASETVAIVGDSHAAHWRPALATVATARRWRVVEVATPHCPLTAAAQSGSAGSWCPAWNAGVLAWLARHPEIRTLFVSAHTRAPVVVPPGAGAFETRVQGFLSMWQRLPASIERIVVLRDNPIARVSTHTCVRRAMRKRKPAARRCALARRALAADAGVAAAARVSRPRAHVIDLTHHFCGARRCFPVVGGVLVHKDVDHLTQLFARTLGPFVLRSFERALAAEASARP